MQRALTWMFALILLAGLAACGGDTPESESATQGTTGWERNGAYGSRYSPDELDRIKGYFQEIVEFTPLAGMAPGIGVIIRDRADDEMVTVHLGPTAFIGAEVENFGLRQGQKVSVRGVWAEFGGQDVFIASKLKKGAYDQLKVRRTKDGMPYWEMSEEELTAERAAEFKDVPEEQRGG